MPPAREAVVGKHSFGVKVVGERNGKEEQDKSAGERRPLMDRVTACPPALVDPARAPQCQDADSDQQPQNIEKRFHGIHKAERAESESRGGE